MTPAALGEWFSVMRAHGVTKFGSGEFSVEFGASPTATAAPEAPAPDCPCGHSAHAHNEFGCLQGCDHRACAPEAKP